MDESVGGAPKETIDLGGFRCASNTNGNGDGAVFSVHLKGFDADADLLRESFSDAMTGAGKHHGKSCVPHVAQRAAGDIPLAENARDRDEVVVFLLKDEPAAGFKLLFDTEEDEREWIFGGDGRPRTRQGTLKSCTVLDTVEGIEAGCVCGVSDEALNGLIGMPLPCRKAGASKKTSDSNGYSHRSKGGVRSEQDGGKPDNKTAHDKGNHAAEHSFLG
jgi:hypothetical protein